MGGVALDHDYSDYKLVVDYKEDYLLTQDSLKELRRANPQFDLEEILTYINTHADRFEETKKLKRNIEYKQN